MLVIISVLLLLTGSTSWLAKADTAPLPTDISICHHQPYKIHIFSRRPLIIYIEDFLSQDEVAQLISLASKSYKSSEVVLKDDTYKSSSINPSQRLSESMYLYSDTAPPVSCIRERAASFQGIESSRLEPLQVVRYATNGFFQHHYDWLSQRNSADPAGLKCNGDPYCKNGMGDRDSTFFVYLQADCEGGETNFPHMEIGKDLDKELWCEFVDCEDGEAGVKWLPRTGNAIFWENLEDKRGIKEVSHAGLPVLDGVKIGLNIWSRERLELERGSGKGNFETYLDGTGEDVERILHETFFEWHPEL